MDPSYSFPSLVRKHRDIVDDDDDDDVDDDDGVGDDDDDDDDDVDAEGSGDSVRDFFETAASCVCRCAVSSSTDRLRVTVSVLGRLSLPSISPLCTAAAPDIPTSPAVNISFHWFSLACNVVKSLRSCCK